MNQSLDIGGVLSRVFQTYAQQLPILLPGALVVFVPIAILLGIVYSTGGVVLLGLTFVLQFIGIFFFTGMVVQLVRDIQDGRRDSSLGQLFASVAPIVGPMIGAAILAGLGIGIGLILLIVPGLYLLTIWAVLIPVIVVERPGIGAAFSRSRDLVKGSGWQVFGVVVIFAIINAVASRIIVSIITGIELSTLTIVIAQLVSNVLIAPLQALAAPVMYFDLLRLRGGEPVPAAGTAAPVEGAPAATPPSTPPATPPPPSSEPPPPPPPPPAAS
jgi:MFS family permease